MNAKPQPDYDVVIIGGGFFGCALALFLRTIFDRILVLEERDALLTRASRVNQARVHTGFHYPRSFVTALRSRELSHRFSRDFSKAVVDDFQMLYAIASRRSKVSKARFLRMFEDMGAPIAPASVSDAALFDPELIEGVFACTEFAFDWSVLRDHMADRMARHGITLRHGQAAEKVEFREDACLVHLASGEVVSAPHVFNVTYGGLNRVLMNSGIEPLPLKYEWAELALVAPPPEMKGKAVTVMDGPFFSMMPYPSENLYSLTHVRYTPHMSWVDRQGGRPAYAVGDSLSTNTRWRHMMMDTRRYMPCAGDLEYVKSVFDVKTVLTRNERDDGRPILLHRHHRGPNFYSVMGGKIDNIYDLFDVMPALDPAFAKADMRYLLGEA
ncbi:FAD-dependent oxidoreductase [Novosphingobium sp. KACC 22771]|uniref:FAD-dependent oxidoreductase n=1 Tax=Novosphingobium sp. KACC 22771 TaxID=3025670 RepID=UPI0023671841|nr:FAD-binding oxidoreductase [Novosphingobium sp. KACC 22771]WDF72865.1 FAD-binding oxidoreductase [Novosphingobium sp. KACC 22771]